MSSPQQAQSTDEKNKVKSRQAQPAVQNKVDNHIFPASAVQQARATPHALTSPQVLQLQRTLGNQAVSQLLEQATNKQSPSLTGPIQRTRVFDPNVTNDDKRLIQLVADNNSILMAAWQWIKNHPAILFTVRRRIPGLNSINAKFGDRAIFFNLNPPKVGDTEHIDEEKFVGTIIHELTLHLLPWVRVMMYHELEANLNNIQAYDPAQLAHIQRLLGPIANNLIAEINADKANKLTTTWGGNHSDMGLWAMHLEGLQNVANAVQNPAPIVLKALEQMHLPLLLTGSIENATDRGPGAHNRVIQALAALQAYRQALHPDQQGEFDKVYDFIQDRMNQYETYLIKKRAVLANIANQLPGVAIDDSLLKFALTKDSVAEATFVYVDIYESIEH